jgi:hypothetical protein
MEQSHQIAELLRNQDVFKELLGRISKEQYQWRWQKEKWNLLEIVCHLYDEEREDFRVRTKSVLENPANALTKFNPVLWVTQRDYASQDYDIMLSRFLKERHESITWLKSLQNPKWENAFDHPKMGPLSAAFFLSNWVAHDYLHIRQILNLKYQYELQTSGNKLDYAGRW